MMKDQNWKSCTFHHFIMIFSFFFQPFTCDTARKKGPSICLSVQLTEKLGNALTDLNFPFRFVLPRHHLCLVKVGNDTFELGDHSPV